MIDTHMHFNDDLLFASIDKYHREANNIGVNGFLVVGYDIKSSKRAIEISKMYNDCFAIIGIHPSEVLKTTDDDYDWIENEATQNPKVVGIGEIGYDLHWDKSFIDKQEIAFRRQLDIASRNGKPIIVHSRDAIGDTYNILKDYKLRGSIHAFSGSVEMAHEFIKLGYMVGVGGVVTFKNAKNIKEVVKSVPLAYILLETDSPYLTPEPYRGEVNSSKNIPLIANKIAELKEVSNIDVLRVTSDNAERVFDFSSK